MSWRAEFGEQERRELTWAVGRVEGWLVADVKVLEKHFATGNFRQTMAFANRIAEIAAEQGHHPDLHLSYRRVIVPQTTHAVGGLSENDFIVTAKVDEAIDVIANR